MAGRTPEISIDSYAGFDATSVTTGTAGWVAAAQPVA